MPEIRRSFLVSVASVPDWVVLVSVLYGDPYVRHKLILLVEIDNLRKVFQYYLRGKSIKMGALSAK